MRICGVPTAPAESISSFAAVNVTNGPVVRRSMLAIDLSRTLSELTARALTKFNPTEDGYRGSGGLDNSGHLCVHNYPKVASADELRRKECSGRAAPRTGFDSGLRPAFDDLMLSGVEDVVG
jgi:hypothetical protein